ncbi:MAG TPA: hypothetical protein VLA17_14820, partial [Candidatus Limnocylindria bacterium]|nr:hypothetical protein [Candidatus Limnocylindria bacterium]
MVNKLLITAILLSIARVTNGTTAAVATSQAGLSGQEIRRLPQVPADSASGAEVAGEQVTEEFHQTYPLSATGRVNLGNINGGVKIKVSDRAAV